MLHASDVEEAVREVLDRLDTTGPRYAALAPYAKFVVASAAAAALSVNVEGNTSVPTVASALLCEARQIVKAAHNSLAISEAASLTSFVEAVADVIGGGDSGGNLPRR